jgi:hypothetical protein
MVTSAAKAGSPIANGLMKAALSATFVQFLITSSRSLLLQRLFFLAAFEDESLGVVGATDQSSATSRSRNAAVSSQAEARARARALRMTG